MLAAVAHPAVRILAHPRGRITGSRAGVVADWDAVFAAAAERGVAIEIDGDPARQDLDYTLAPARLKRAASSRSTAMRIPPTQLAYAETALAHARLAGIPAERHRELLAAGPAACLAVESVIGSPTVMASSRRIR